MSKLFENLKTDGLEETEDRVGGGGPLPSDVYDVTIKMAYAGKSARGARSVTIIADTGRGEVRETLYITNVKGEHFYVDKSDKKERPLPGFTTVDNICLLTTEEPLASQDAEEKMVKIWDFDERKEIPKPVDVLIDLIGKRVKLAIFRDTVDKNKEVSPGKYEPSGETRQQNSIAQAMHIESGRTVQEYRHEIEDPVFMNDWLKLWKGKDRNKAKGASGGGTTGTGRPGFANSSGTPDGAPKKKLFG